MNTQFTDVQSVYKTANTLKGKRILFACVPADGHFNPLTGLAKHLQSLGCDVRWYSSRSYEAKLQKLQIKCFPFVKALEVTGDTVNDAFPERVAIKNKIKKLNFDLVNFFILEGPKYYADIKDLHQSFSFDVMICDCLFTAIPFVTHLMQIPVISVGVFPLAETSKDLAPSGLGMEPSRTVMGGIKQAFLRSLADNVLFKQANKALRKVLNEYGIPNKNINLFDILVKKSTLLLQSGTRSFEYSRSDLGKNIRFVGALLPYAGAQKSSAWFDERLNTYNRIVLVTQGTVEKDVSKLLVPTLEAFKNTDTLIVATTGGSQTQELRTKYACANIVIEDFIPFENVMPYADVYVTNGGYGGVMLAIENKLPLVVAGVHEGKNEINARIGFFKLGINLKTETPLPRQIVAAVNNVIHDKIYKQNIEELSNEFSQYNPNTLCANYVTEVLDGAHLQSFHLLNHTI